jgi:hypothetical protein
MVLAWTLHVLRASGKVLALRDVTGSGTTGLLAKPGLPFPPFGWSG